MPHLREWLRSMANDLHTTENALASDVIERARQQTGRTVTPAQVYTEPPQPTVYEPLTDDQVFGYKSPRESGPVTSKPGKI